MNETASVYQLVGRLCASLIDRDADENLSVKTAKRIAFEILLQSNVCEAPDKNKLLQELQFASFEISMAKRESQQIDQVIDTIGEKSPDFLQVCWLLLQLKNIDPDPQSKQQDEKNFVALPSNFKQLTKRNVYIQNETQPMLRLSSVLSTPDDDCSFLSSILDKHVGNKKLKNEPMHTSILKPLLPPTALKPPQRKFKTYYSWGNLADDDGPNKSFSSETIEPVFLRLSASRSKTPVEVKTVSFEKLLNDIKLLTIGIESESFRRADHDPLTFFMPIKVSCNDISDVNELVHEFIEAGSCYKRLKTFTSKNPFNQSYIFEGFIIQAFCDCIIKFLAHYRDVVYSQEVETLLEFKANTRSIRETLVYITKFLKIHPTSTTKSLLPSGSDFLGMLYNEYTTVFNHDVKCFFVECLKSCFQIYCNNFHKWLFQGYIEDPHKELFIYFVDHYRPNTKYFFDKAYIIRKQSVPGFLQGCADNILLCGKYTMLLKSYNQVHPLFMIPKPKLQVCLTHEEMSETKAQCDKFTKAAREACGRSISIAKLMHDREKAKKEKYKKAELASHDNMMRWRQEQEILRIELAEKREVQQKGLRDELQRIEERKMVKRMESIQAERDYLDEVEEIESTELEKENMELQQRIKTLQTLNEQLDKEAVQRQEIVTDLRITLESKDDKLNANQPTSSPEVVKTDEMNNILPKTTITDAQRNRNKVMSHEYNVITGDSTEITETTEVAVSQTTNDPMTDRHRNKLKVMGTEFGLIDVQKPTIQVQTSDVMTDLQKNRLKVLSHEYNLEKVVSAKPKMSLNLLQVERPQHHLESPMSVTSDHFSNESDHQQPEGEEKSPEGQSEKSQDVDDDELELLRAFEEAVEKNSQTFMGINLANYSPQSQSLASYEHIKTTNTMALSRFFQLSLMVPVNAYMDILNNETLKMFILDLDILSHFKSLRNYYLMMNGEFGSSICHLLFSKLESGVRPVELLNFQSLHMILDHALSQTRNDPNIEKLSFIVENIPEKFELHSPSVLNMLTMSYKLEWPLNLILNPETMTQYKTIFNYLLRLKRISWVLEDCFQTLKEMHKKHGKELLASQQYRNMQQIRHKMTHFVHCLENHVTRNVLQISWSAFVEDLKSAQSILCIYRKHTSYLKRILFLCLLNKKSVEFQKTVKDAFQVILKFQKHLKSKDWQYNEGKFSHPKYEKIEADGADFEQLIKFILYMGNKIVQHGYQQEINDLLYLIDINGFYSQS